MKNDRVFSLDFPDTKNMLPILRKVSWTSIVGWILEYTTANCIGKFDLVAEDD